MNEDIKNLILAIAAGDAVESENLFNSIMDAKAAEHINELQGTWGQTIVKNQISAKSFPGFKMAVQLYVGYPYRNIMTPPFGTDVSKQET